MEGKFYIAFLVLVLVSTALAKGGHRRRGKHRGDYNKCPQPVISDEVPMKCTVTDHCGTYTCTAEFEGESVTLSLKFDRSQYPLSAEISLKVPGKGFDWSHTFKSGDKIQVPGFPLTIMGRGGADIFLTLTMDKRWRGLSFQLDLILSSDVEDMDVPLLQGKLPLKYDDDDDDDVFDDDDDDDDYDDDDDDDDDDDREIHYHPRKRNRFVAWFKRQSAGAKAALVISALWAFALLVTGCVYCCKKRRGAKVADMVKVEPPSYDEATTIETKVPLEE